MIPRETMQTKARQAALAAATAYGEQRGEFDGDQLFDMMADAVLAVCVEEFRKYLRHRDDCDAAAWEQRARVQVPNYERPKCSCGLDTLLASVEQGQKEEDHARSDQSGRSTADPRGDDRNGSEIPFTAENVHPNTADALLHPVSQVYFRAGLIACREYMARFVEAESPSIANSIRANWWPVLGKDFGPPRKLDWSEVTSGAYGAPDFRITNAEELSPTQEALPIALGFLKVEKP